MKRDSSKKERVEIIKSYFVCCVLSMLCSVMLRYAMVGKWRFRRSFSSLMNEVWIEREEKNIPMIYQIMYEIICRTKSNFHCDDVSSKNDKFMFLFTLFHLWHSKISFHSDGFQTHWKDIMKTMSWTIQIKYVHLLLVFFLVFLVGNQTDINCERQKDIELVSFNIATDSNWIWFGSVDRSNQTNTLPQKKKL